MLKKIISLILATVLLLSAVSILGACDNGGDTNDTDNNTKTTYTVTLLAGDTPISSAAIKFFSDDGQSKTVLTDANGVASYTAESGKWQAKIALLTGYEFDADKAYDFVDGKVTITLKDNSTAKETLTVYVKDAAGNAVAGQSVQVCDTDNMCLSPKTTDAEGKVTFEVDPGKIWKAALFGSTDYAYFTAGEATITVE